MESGCFSLDVCMPLCVCLSDCECVCVSQTSALACSPCDGLAVGVATMYIETFGLGEKSNLTKAKRRRRVVPATQQTDD